MDWDRLITIEQMEEATNTLLETGKKVGADSWQQRVKNQTPHCGFGEAGTCCRICSMGPCRITPKAPRGICGCDVHGIVARNYLRFTAGGSATHSDHGRQICHTLYQTKEGGAYQVKDPEKLKRIAKEWDIETEGKDIYDLAHEVAEVGLLEYGKPFGVTALSEACSRAHAGAVAQGRHRAARHRPRGFSVAAYDPHGLLVSS